MNAGFDQRYLVPGIELYALMIHFFFEIENLINERIFGLPRRWLGQLILPRLSLLIIAGVLLLSAVLPFRATSRQMTLLLGLIPAIGAVLVFLRWPPLGLIALIITSFLAPSPRLPGGLNLAVLLLIFLIGLWLLELIAGRDTVQLIRSRTVPPLIALVLVATLSFGVGQLPWFVFANPAPLDAQLGGLGIFVLAAGAFLLGAHQIRNLRWLERLTWLFLALGGFYMVGRLVPAIRPFTTDLFDPNIDRNSMFWTWLMALAASQAVLNRRLHPRWRVGLAALALATFYVAFVKSYGWKSGFLPPLVSVAAIIGFRSPRLGLVLVLVGALPAYYLGSQAIATDQYSYSTRLDAWLIVLDMIKANPLLGFGPANYYWYTPLFPIRGYSVAFNSHNQYIDIVAQTGILGLACVFWFAWAVIRLGWRLRARVPAGFAQAFVYGALGGWVGTLASGMLVDWFLPFVYNIGLKGFRASVLPWLFLGGLVALEKMYKEDKSNSS